MVVGAIGFVFLWIGLRENLFARVKIGAAILVVAVLLFFTGLLVVTPTEHAKKLISGFALDVYEVEPVQNDFLNSIKKNTNCILTPHIAGVTKESNTRVSEFIANSVLEFFKL